MPTCKLCGKSGFLLSVNEFCLCKECNQAKGKVGGLIKFYNLENWWISNFSEEEREYIDKKYDNHNTLTKGKIEISLFKQDFLTYLLSNFSTEDFSISEIIKKKIIEVSKNEPIIKGGYFNGRHYTSYLEEINQLIRENKLEDVEKLLISCIEATEAESKEDHVGVAPYYYEKLAQVYRKQKNLKKELLILERFSYQKHAPGVKPPRLLIRLEKVKELIKSEKG